MKEETHELHSMISIGLAAKMILNRLRVVAQLDDKERQTREQRGDTDTDKGDSDGLDCRI